MSESLQTRLQDSALLVLRRHGISAEEVELEEPKTGGLLLKSHRVRVHVDEKRADFQVRGGRWGGAAADYPSVGAFVADFEAMLERAMTGWR